MTSMSLYRWMSLHTMNTPKSILVFGNTTARTVAARPSLCMSLAIIPPITTPIRGVAVARRNRMPLPSLSQYCCYFSTGTISSDETTTTRIVPLILTSSSSSSSKNTNEGTPQVITCTNTRSTTPEQVSTDTSPQDDNNNNNNNDVIVVYHQGMEINVNKEDDLWFEKVTNKVLKSMNQEQLQQLARTLGIISSSLSSGNQNKLCKRIQKVRNAHKKQHVNHLRQTQHVQYYREAKHACHERGLSTRGNVLKLLHRLEKHKHRTTRQEDMLLEAHPAGCYKHLCRQLGMKVDGLKVTLIRRLERASVMQRELRTILHNNSTTTTQQQQQDDEEEDDEDDEDECKENVNSDDNNTNEEEPVLKFEEWQKQVLEIPKEELKQLCREQGLQHQGTRWRLIQSLHAFLTNTNKKYIRKAMISKRKKKQQESENNNDEGKDNIHASTVTDA